MKIRDLIDEKNYLAAIQLGGIRAFVLGVIATGVVIAALAILGLVKLFA